MSSNCQIATVFISGLFGLVVAATTSLLADRKDSGSFERLKAKEHYEEIKALYAEYLSVLHMLMTYTANHLDETHLFEKYSTQHTKLELLAAPEVTKQADTLMEQILAWVKEYRLENPNAKRLALRINDEKTVLINAMRVHLDELR